MVLRQPQHELVDDAAVTAYPVARGPVDGVGPSVRTPQSAIGELVPDRRRLTVDQKIGDTAAVLIATGSGRAGPAEASAVTASAVIVPPKSETPVTTLCARAPAFSATVVVAVAVVDCTVTTDPSAG